jgi:hypothetical protein
MKGKKHHDFGSEVGKASRLTPELVSPLAFYQLPIRGKAGRLTYLSSAWVSSSTLRPIASTGRVISVGTVLHRRVAFLPDSRQLCPLADPSL